MTSTKRLLFITLFTFSISVFSNISLAKNKVPGLLKQKTKVTYYYHICVHDKGSNGFIAGGYPKHTYDVYTFVSNSKKANLSNTVIIQEALTSNLNITVSSDGSMGSKTISKQYVINEGSGYSLDALDSGANLKMTVSSISLSSYLYNGNTIHLDYTVHFF